MANVRGVAGPICSTRVGEDWIDDGTLCRTKSPSKLPAAFFPVSPFKLVFDSAHVYSLAPEARRKRAIDLEIIGHDYSKSAEIRIDNEDYLKKLISIASRGMRKVRSRAHGMQFFIIRGGAEGLLEEEALRSVNAGDHDDWDDNDLLAVFGSSGTLIGSAAASPVRFRPARGQPPDGQGSLRRLGWGQNCLHLFQRKFRDTLSRACRIGRLP